MMGALQLAALFLLAGPGEGSPGFDLSAPAETDFERRLRDAGQSGPSDDEGDKSQQEDQKPQRPEAPSAGSSPQSQSQSVFDFGWLELYPRAGLALFSSKYHIKGSPCLEIEARAPIPWLSPESNPEGDYFGGFAQLNMAMIKRTIQPKLAKASGIMSSLALGLDYSVYRDETWLLMARLGFQYTNYGGVTDLKDGGQAVMGITAGLNLSRSILLTITPEIVYAKTGDYILMGLAGIAVEF
jgi:hypothetical protein